MRGCEYEICTNISTHSLTKRLTSLMLRGSETYEYFNSQPHEEADEQAFSYFYEIAISTHSLTKRLTGK